MTPVALTIAGSDSGGGAGIQADLKAFGTLGIFGTSALTCVTAQSPDEVAGVEALPPAMVSLQIETVCKAFPVAAVKTGMLFSAPIIEAVAASVEKHRFTNLVVDPVMVATSGARLLREDAVAALCGKLLPLATVITPNVPEAEWLLSGPLTAPLGTAPGAAVPSPRTTTIASEHDAADAARELSRALGTSCVVKGGHLSGDTVSEFLCHDGEVTRLEAPRLDVGETHGTGCTFAAALAGWLARGAALPVAVEKARDYVATALRRRVSTGRHQPLGWGFGEK